MMKLVCLFALLAVVVAMPNDPSPMRQLVRREAVAPEAAKSVVEEDGPALENPVEAQDDMDKAETFGFGYKKIIHVGVPYPYYPAYHHYPGYYHGYHHYGHYW